MYFTYLSVNLPWLIDIFICPKGYLSKYYGITLSYLFVRQLVVLKGLEHVL